MNSINAKHLREFLLLSEVGNINAAAKELLVTPQGLNKSIQRMESDLGVSLFNRTKEGLILTNEGADLKKRAVRIIEDFDSITADGLKPEVNNKEASGGKTNVFLDVTNGEIDYFRLSDLRDFMAKNPGIFVSVNECSDLAIMEHVTNGKADIGLCAGPINSNLYSGNFLHSCRHCIVVHKDDPLAQKESIRFSDLKGRTLIFNSKEYTTYNNNMNRCLKAGFMPDIIFHSQNLENAHLMASKKEGVVISVEDVVEKQHLTDIVPSVRVIPFAEDEECSFDIFMITKKEGVIRPEVFLLKEYIMDWAERRFGQITR